MFLCSDSREGGDLISPFGMHPLLSSDLSGGIHPVFLREAAFAFPYAPPSHLRIETLRPIRGFMHGLLYMGGGGIRQEKIYINL